MPNYLMSEEEVKANATFLGKLIDYATYAAALDEARGVVKLENPRIGLVVQYKDGMNDFFEGTPPPMPYGITPGEWGEFLAGWEAYFSECPAVYVYDANQFTFPI